MNFFFFHVLFASKAALATFLLRLSAILEALFI